MRGSRRGQTEDGVYLAGEFDATPTAAAFTLHEEATFERRTGNAHSVLEGATR